MHWKDETIQSTILEIGDSVYVHPNIPHSFISNTKDEAEIIAVNF
jgi:quercetin dioxygenase-like cupin family protein